MNNPECWVCNHEIQPGDSRKAEPHPATQETRIKHDTQGKEAPEGYISSLEPMDKFELSINGGDWVTASVEGVGVCGRAYMVYGLTRREYHERPYPEVPFGYTDQFEILVPWTPDGWGQAKIHERENIWQTTDSIFGTADHEIVDIQYHDRGNVAVRPTDLTDSQIQWDFWADRPTHPQDLHERYLVDGQTVQEMADEFGVSGWTVRQWMDKAGIPRNGGNTNGQPV